MTNIITHDANTIAPEGGALATLTFLIEGMSCTSCAARICSALKEQGNDIHQATIEFSDRRAEVLMRKGNHEASALAAVQLVEKLGYTVKDAFLVDPELGKKSSVNANSLHDGEPYSHHKPIQREAEERAKAEREPSFVPCKAPHASPPKPPNSQSKQKEKSIFSDMLLCETQVLIQGMSCASCAARIESRLLKTPGVEKASVNFTMLSAKILHVPAEVSLAALLRVIHDLGYSATVLSSDAEKKIETAGDFAPFDSVSKPDGTNMNGTPLANPTGDPMAAFSSSYGGPQKPMVRMLIEGMSCASCAARIERALARLSFVVECSVSFTTGIGVITTTSANVLASPTEKNEAKAEDPGIVLVREVRRMGYEASVLPAPGADPREAKTHTALVDAEDDASALARTRQALERTKEIRYQKMQFFYSAVLSIPLAAAMVLMAAAHDTMENRTVSLVSETVQLACATPVVFYFGRQFFVGAWHGVWVGAFTMDTLVAIGVGSSYLYSLVIYVVKLACGVRMTTYFEAAGLLTTFMLLGRYLEARAKRSTSGALIELMSLVPRRALVVGADGADRVVEVAEVRPGMKVRVLAGERVPVDGVVLAGPSDVDEQMVTGESLPVHVGPGSAVIGGTLNLTAAFLMLAERVGEETTLSGILRVMEEAQAAKPAVQRVADRLAMYFVPFVVGTAVATLLTWLALGAAGAYPAGWRHGEGWVGFAFNFFIATVVSACPCALGLATPTAIMVGTGVGARQGVLIKSGAVLESVREARCVVFDKTGTITTGKLEVVRMQSFPARVGAGDAPTTSTTDAIVRRCVVAVEELSTHPIAHAIVEALRSATPPLQGGAAEMDTVSVLSSTTHPGKGVEATVSITSPTPAHEEKADETLARSHHHHHHVVVSNLTLMHELDVVVADEVAGEVRRRGERSFTTVVAAVDGVCRLVISLSNEPKPEARGVVRELRRRGMRVMMITGDSVEVARRIGEEVGIAPENIYAAALPATKSKIVQQIQHGENQQEGGEKTGKKKRVKVMFVGDGINDSPALAQADVGVALGAGTDVAIEAADAVLMHNALSDIINLREISAMTVRRIYANFAWAFIYNLIMLPLASGAAFPLIHIQLPPVLAGLAMVSSSITVLLSSLSIRLFKPVKKEDFL